MKNTQLILIPLLFLLASPLIGQLSPEEAVAGMGRGINLGNTLEPPTEGAWNNGPAQEAFFDTYLEAGFSNIRIPVRWNQHTANTAPFAIDESWMNRVEQVVDWGLTRGFFITLNTHHEDWLKEDYSNPILRDRFDAIWVQIAERFKNKSDKLLFEMINEPNGMTVADVDDLNQRILGIIRGTNPTRNVIYSGNMYSNSQQLLNAQIPDDDYIIGYYHAYDPWQFSGQGMGTWGTPNDYQQVTNKYQSVKNWSTTNNIPIHHSEFGAILTCDFNSRMRIYAHNVEQSIVNGFAFSVWDDGGDFGVLNRANNTWPELKDVLMHYHEDSPNEITSVYSPDPANNDPRIVINWNNRVTGNGDIILEVKVGASGQFESLATLSANANNFTHLDVEVGKSYTYRMYTTRMDGTLLHGYPTRVSIPASFQTPFNDNPIPIPGNLEVEEYDNGGEGLAYHDNDAANISGGFRLDEGVDLGAFGNGYILGYVEEGEWIEYTVEVAQSGTYSIKAEVASEIDNGSFSITFDKNNASTNFATPGTGGWVAFQEITANSQIELEAGVQVMRLDITNSNAFNLDKLIFNLETVGIAELESTKLGFDISPNPTSGRLNIYLSNGLQRSNFQLELLSINGEKIASFPTKGAQNYIDLSNFENGVYLLQLIGDNMSLFQRVLLQ